MENKKKSQIKIAIISLLLIFITNLILYATSPSASLISNGLLFITTTLYVYTIINTRRYERQSGTKDMLKLTLCYFLTAFMVLPLNHWHIGEMTLYATISGVGCAILIEVFNKLQKIIHRIFNEPVD